MIEPAAYSAPNERLVLKPRYNEENECGICLDNMCGSLVRKLPCNHEFHESCHAHLRNGNGHYRYRCPICRANYTGQIQRMKMYDIWKTDADFQMSLIRKCAITGENSWSTNEELDRVTEFHAWIISGASEQERYDMISSINYESDGEVYIPHYADTENNISEDSDDSSE